MDFDKDGKLDFVSGSYDPGEVFLFRALGKSRFVRGEMLFDEAGIPLVHHPVQWVQYESLRKTKDAQDPEVVAAKVASIGSFAMPCDFDGDGCLDMLIGSLRGEVFLRRGVVPGKATRKGPRGPFSADSFPLQAAGAPLKVHSHADPFVADWDGDGTWDLVVGAGDGSVVWFRNEGTPKAPVFAAACELVAAKSKTDSTKRQTGADGVPLPGTRAQICVADHDCDGRADLIVGDYANPGAGSKQPTSYIWLYRRAGPTTPSARR
ncbi:MAG TPA: VCBS repeat-containing protein [Planctomycetota bacterium]